MKSDLEQQREELIKRLEARLPQPVRELLAQVPPPSTRSIVVVTKNEQGSFHADAQ
jgi:hypothetical protein